MPEETQDIHTQVAVLASKMDQLTSDIKEIKTMLFGNSDKYLTKSEFQLYKSLIMGMVGAILLAFLGGLASLVWKT